MKQLSTSLLLWAGVGLAASAGTTTVDQPPFAFNTHSNVTIERIVLSESSTILDMVIYADPATEIRISSDTYINADGKKHMLQSSEGIPLNQLIRSDESGKIVFSLIFPPVDTATRQIDFIESDCDHCFKIYGLALTPDVQLERLSVPRDVRKAAAIKDDGKALPAPQLKYGKAVLKGSLLGYRPAINTKVNVYVNNPVTGVQEMLETDVQSDGSFELEVPLVVTMQVLLRLSAPWYNKYILLSPAEESTIYFDLWQKSCQETPIASLKCPPVKYIYFGGANAEINNQMEDVGLAELRQQIYDNQKSSAIAEMTLEQYKAHILGQVAALTAELSQKGLTRKALEFATGSIQYSAADFLMLADSDLREAFRKAHNLSHEDPLTGFTEPDLNDEFYSFLKDASINDPRLLYDFNCSYIINSCQYLKKTESRITFTSKDTYQALINSGKLSPDELEAATFLRDSTALDNPAAKERLKFKHLLIIRGIVNTGKLNHEQMEMANNTLPLCTDTSVTALAAVEQTFRLMMELNSKEVLTFEEMNNILKEVENLSTASNEVSRERLMAFSEKYAAELALPHKKQQVKEKTATLARLLGTDSGVAFDLLEVQLICQKMEEFTPLDADDLQRLSLMDNQFYLDYLTTKNNELLAQINELLAQIEANRRKGGYTIHETPETDGKQTFTQIMKTFEGKVVLVDFWATWCGPCRVAMKQFEPDKGMLKEKGVVFVYLTDESSPINVWHNMIPSISGEHFRLKNSQMNELEKKFGITGIPTYLILNKQGEQIYFNTGFDGNAIKKTLMEAL